MKSAGGLRGLGAAIGAGLVALGLAFAPAAARDPAAQADAPALWRIDGPKGKVFLFGSFHLLPADVTWRTPAVERALNEAEVVVLETDFAESQDQQVMQALLVKYGMLPQGQTLRAVLPGKTNAEFEKLAADLRLPPSNLAPLRPWLAALILSVQFIVNQGLDPGKGVDPQVTAWARANAKTLAALETNESQLRIFADLAPEQEVELLAATLRQIREMPQMLGEVLAAYRKGDLAALERTLNLGFDDFPALRRRLLKDRHDRWLPQIERMIADGRTHIVIAGAAHFVGPDSVIRMLRAKGVKVEGP